MLGISWKPNVQNTCLPLHITIGLLELKIISVQDVVNKYGKFFRIFLGSSYMRKGVPTIMSFIKKLKLAEKICIRLINAIEVNNFTLLDRYFGNLLRKQSILHTQRYISFKRNS